MTTNRKVYNVIKSTSKWTPCTGKGNMGIMTIHEARKEAKRLNSLENQHKVTVISEKKSFSCHYCGMPATSFGFFSEPVCKGCGG
jgi:hypothetical protein